MNYRAYRPRDEKGEIPNRKQRKGDRRIVFQHNKGLHSKRAKHDARAATPAA